MALPNLHDITSGAQLKGLLSKDAGQIALINFWAKLDSTPWAQSNEIVFELAKKYPKLLVLQVCPPLRYYLLCTVVIFFFRRLG